MTIDDLTAYGADTASGLERCMGMADLYLRLVESVRTETKFDELAQALAADNLDDAFSAAHALKGILANLSLTPLLTPIEQMTELLRHKTPADYATLMATITAELERFRALP